VSAWGFQLEQVTAGWSESGKKVFTEINLVCHLHQSTLLPLMGPSGQGKSTLLCLLAALKWPQQGTVTWQLPQGTVFKWDYRGISQKLAVQLRRDYFGFAFQASTLSPHLTVRENIAYPLLLQGKKWKTALAIAETRVEEVLLDPEKAEKATLMTRFPSQLSGGQRQRIALAQAIIHDPVVLFADEPTGQLDLRTRQQVMQVLKHWVQQGQGQRALIWVTHHHLDDLDLMMATEFLFVENQRCDWRNRQWLENWVSLTKRR